MRKTETKLGFADGIRHIVLAWLAAVTVEYLLLPGALRSLADLQGLAAMSFVRVMLMTLCGSAVLTVLSLRRSIAAAERGAMVGIFAILAGVSLIANFTWAYLAVCVLILAGLVGYLAYGWNARPEPKAPQRASRKGLLWGAAAMAAVFFLFVSVWTVCRVASFSTPSYDFGLFSQMFHYMKETGLPMTTLERDGLLSHFHVHMSPIYYLMLPFYVLFPTPATLQILQAAVLASAVIPLWKIGRVHGLADWQRMLLCAVLLLFPAFSGGTSYDLHENCFLTPLILWLFYGIDRKSIPITAMAAVLTLMVKEDAAVYVAVIALWLVVRSMLHRREGAHKSLATGTILLTGSLAWFFLVTGFLANIGDGVMTYRYDNFIYDGSSSLLTVIKAVLMSPMKAVYECVDPEKLSFLVLTMLPLLGLPLLTRRYERYILLIPYVLVNLMSDYRYQHDVFFQYNFGSTACLMYLTAVNLADFQVDWRKTAALAGAVIVSGFCFLEVIVPKASIYPKKCQKYGASYQHIRDTLAQIPEESPVASSTFYTTALSGRKVLYDVQYCSQEHLLDCTYVVVSETEKDKEKLTQQLRAEGYEVYDRIENVLTIYTRGS